MHAVHGEDLRDVGKRSSYTLHVEDNKKPNVYHTTRRTQGMCTGRVCVKHF